MNKIILYKVPWNYGGIEQPYFISDISRDNYFNSLPNKQVNHDGVNIKVDFNFEINLKVNIDIVQAEEFNYAIITYNDKNFYCDIIDMAHISIGFTRLELKRHILAERTNYFQYFKDFEISKATFNELNFNKNTKIFNPDYIRYSTTTKEVDITINSSGTLWFDKATYEDFYIIYRTKLSDVGERETIFYGEVLQYDIIIAPAKNDRETKYAFRNLNGEIKIYTCYNTSSFTRFLNKLSPNIISMEFIKLPVVKKQITAIDALSGKEVTVFCVLIPGFGEWIDPSILSTDVQSFRLIQSHNAFGVNDVYSIPNVLKNSTIMEKNTFLYYNQNNAIEVENFKYSEFLNTLLNFELFFIFSSSGSQVKIVISTSPNSITGSTSMSNIYLFPFMSETTYTINSAANFDAQNRYYNSLTKNSNSQKVISGVIQSTENLVIGAGQIAGGIASGSPGTAIMGGGNVVRGISEIGKTANDSYHFLNERRLLAKQEKEKPAESCKGLSAVANLMTFFGRFLQVTKTPLKEDLDYFYSNLYKYGVDTFIFRENILLDEHIVDNNFFIQGIGKRNSKIITTREFNEMLLYLNGGSCYFKV